MLQRAKTILATNTFTALYDKGYHTGSEFKTANQLGIETLVAIPGIGRASQAPDPNYNSEHFKYNQENDTYTCPQKNTLKSNGSTYKGRNYRFKQYKTNKCRTCPARALCTTSKVNGKVIQRSEYHQYIEENAQYYRILTLIKRDRLLLSTLMELSNVNGVLITSSLKKPSKELVQM